MTADAVIAASVVAAWVSGAAELVASVEVRGEIVSCGAWCDGDAPRRGRSRTALNQSAITSSWIVADSRRWDGHAGPSVPGLSCKRGGRLWRMDSEARNREPSAGTVSWPSRSHKCFVAFIQVCRFQMSRMVLELTPYFTDTFELCPRIRAGKSLKQES